MYLASQIIGIFIIVEGFFIYYQRKRKNILILKIISDVLSVSQYLLLFAYAGAALNLIAIFRSIVFYFRNDKQWAKSRFWLYFFMAIMFLSPLVTSNQPIFSLLWFISFVPGLGSAFAVVGYYSNNPHSTRIFVLIGTALWLVYAIAFFNWTGVISGIVAIVSLVYGLIWDCVQISKANKKEDLQIVVEDNK